MKPWTWDDSLCNDTRVCVRVIYDAKRCAPPTYRVCLVRLHAFILCNTLPVRFPSVGNLMQGGGSFVPHIIVL